MHLQHNNNQSEASVIQMFSQNDENTWGRLYDTYAPMMYGTILKMTDNETIAGEILEETFVALQDKKMFLGGGTAMCHNFIQQAYKTTLKSLKERGLLPTTTQPFNANYPLINHLYLQGLNLKEALSNSDVSEEDVRKNLRAEFMALRNQRK